MAYRLSHGELSPGRYICLAVADSGRGFDDTIARRLFEPFFTTRAAGTGLGLATVHEIVRDHDGGMNVESKLGQGSLFEAWLPVAPRDVSEVTRPAMLRGRGQTVMVVESERERLLRDEEMLAALGLSRSDSSIPPMRSRRAARRPTGSTSFSSATPRELSEVSIWRTCCIRSRPAGRCCLQPRPRWTSALKHWHKL